jgi:hypothetical protein
MTPDPYMASGGPKDPGSWNRYAYGSADPVNNNDPSGLDENPPTLVCTINTGFFYGEICQGFLNSISISLSGYFASANFAGAIAAAEAAAQGWGSVDVTSPSIKHAACSPQNFMPRRLVPTAIVWAT